ncbi:MAG: hypothetical protein ABIQ15_11140 [Nocardioides sp.]
MLDRHLRRVGAEVVEHYADAQHLVVLDVADATAPTKLLDLQTVGVSSADGSVVPVGAVANSVAVREDGLGVVGVESVPKTDEGWLVFLDAGADGSASGAVRVGAQPDMVTITPDGTRAVVADAGKPAEDYTVHPRGIRRGRGVGRRRRREPASTSRSTSIPRRPT